MTHSANPKPQRTYSEKDLRLLLITSILLPFGVGHQGIGRIKQGIGIGIINITMVLLFFLNVAPENKVVYVFVFVILYAYDVVKPYRYLKRLVKPDSLSPFGK